jgi:hypothetical protein
VCVRALTVSKCIPEYFCNRQLGSPRQPNDVHNIYIYITRQETAYILGSHPLGLTRAITLMTRKYVAAFARSPLNPNTAAMLLEDRALAINVF